MAEKRVNNGSKTSDRSLIKRRELLAALSGVGAVGLAGCGSNTNVPSTGTTVAPPPKQSGGTNTQSGTPRSTQEDLAHVSGQTLNMPLYINPENTTFVPSQEFPEEGTTFENAGGPWTATMEPGHWGAWMNEGYQGLDLQKSYKRLWERFEVVDNKTVEAKVIDDAYWSDGEQITAIDAAGALLLHTQRPHGNNAEILGFIDAINAVDFPDGPDGLRVTYRSKTGSIGSTREEIVWDWLGRRENAFRFPTHIEPYKSIVETSIEQLPKWQDKAEDTNTLMTRSELRNEHFTDKVFKKFRNPDNVVTSGAWTLKEIRGTTEIVLKPNEHWRHADQVNFDEVVFQYLSSEHRRQAELQADRLDFESLLLPQGSIKSLPNSYEVVKKAVRSGRSLGLNLGHPQLSKRNVRAAIAYALDQKTIAENVHPSTATPINVPGGDVLRPGTVTSDQWIKENLIDYSQNVEKATSLMQDAGFSKQDGTWVGPEGNKMSFQLATPSSTPAFEQTVASQLSDFGIEIQVQSYEDATFEDRWENGDFNMWREHLLLNGIGFATQMLTDWDSSLKNSSRMRTYNWYHPNATNNSMEAYKESFKIRESNGSPWVQGDYKIFEKLSIPVPPIGQPNGDPQKGAWSPAYVFWKDTTVGDGLQKSEYKKAMWTLNWYLHALPVVQMHDLNYIDSAHFIWPKNTPAWNLFQIALSTSHLLSMNMIKANPNNPEEGATVEA